MDGERSNEGINVLKKDSLGPTSLILEPGTSFFSDLPEKGGFSGEVPKDIKLKIVFFGSPDKITGFTKCQVLKIEKFHGEIKDWHGPEKLNFWNGPKSWSVEPLNKVYCSTGDLEEKLKEKERNEKEAELKTEKILAESRIRNQEIFKDLERIKEEKRKFRKPWISGQRKEAYQLEESERKPKEGWLPYKDEEVPMPKRRRKKS